ncbi:MAG: hypothetical protein H8E46_04465 [FCB group bacterium]|nr:hypothetical protein [FCB group bacterium]
MDRPDWLPDIIAIQQDEKLEDYIDRIYQQFSSDFKDKGVTYKGLPVYLKKQPLQENKEASFWHIITSVQGEDRRKLNLPRCVRIAWIKWIIENSNSDLIKVWENERNYEKRVLLFLDEQDYLIVLTKRKDYYLLWTAYMVSQKHSKKKLLNEYHEYINAETAH